MYNNDKRMNNVEIHFSMNQSLLNNPHKEVNNKMC